jgi:hypothetical protein
VRRLWLFSISVICCIVVVPEPIEKAIKLVNKWKGKVVDNNSCGSNEGANDPELTH